MLDKEHQEEDEDLDFRALENGFVSLVFLHFLINWYRYGVYGSIAKLNRLARSLISFHGVGLLTMGDGCLS